MLDAGKVGIQESSPATGPRAGIRRWVVLCAAAEGLGMTAAAAAAKTSLELYGEPAGSREVTVVLSLVVAGGLVEGVALGGLQALGLRALWPRLSVARFLLVTMAVAGLGWAAASAPAVLTGPDDGAAPAVLPVLAGAVALGLVMGAVLGAVQAAVLRSHVRHPWRWVTANAAGWAPAMAVIFFGAALPDTDWSVLAVLAAAAVAGVTAGTVLGLVTGWFIPSLDGSPAYNRLVLGVLSSPAHGLADGSLVGLRVRGRVTGRTFELPVQFATDGSDLVVVPARPQTKRWWRNLRTPAPVGVLEQGRWVGRQAQVVSPGDPGHRAALAAYRRRWPRVRIPDDVPVVRVVARDDQGPPRDDREPRREGTSAGPAAARATLDRPGGHRRGRRGEGWRAAGSSLAVTRRRARRRCAPATRAPRGGPGRGSRRPRAGPPPATGGPTPCGPGSPAGTRSCRSPSHRRAAGTKCAGGLPGTRMSRNLADRGDTLQTGRRDDVAVGRRLDELCRPGCSVGTDTGCGVRSAVARVCENR